MQALEIAKKNYHATTILITGIESPLNPNVDFRLETCTQENCGAFTISLSCAITRIIQWIGLSNKDFIEKFCKMHIYLSILPTILVLYLWQSFISISRLL
jgi:hypothetical protein